MGICGLWKKVAPTSETMSLMGLVLALISSKEGPGNRTPIITCGVDASPMLFSAQAAVAQARHRGASGTITGSKAEMNVLVSYLSQFAEIPANIEFWFDSPNGRPVSKRNKRVSGPEHQLTKDFKELIQGFGFQAPGEAEAELAYRNRVNALDFVYTPDSDIFLFGATRVVRSAQDPTNRDAIQLYTEEHMVQCEPRRLSRAGIFFIAVLSGGDYNTTGLPGCGIDTAYALADSRLAVSLFEAVQSKLSDEDLRQFLDNWRGELRKEFSTNSMRHLRSRKPALATRVTESFPDIEVLRLYGSPLTSETAQGAAVPSVNVSNTRRSLQLPDIEKLTLSLCRIFNTWEWCQVLNLLCVRVWPGHFTRQLMDITRASSLGRNDGLGLACIDGISRIDSSKSKNAPFPYFRVKIWPVSQSSRALHTFIHAHNLKNPSPGDVAISETTLVSVPSPVLHRAQPDLVDNYCQQHPKNWENFRYPGLQVADNELSPSKAESKGSHSGPIPPNRVQEAGEAFPQDEPTSRREFIDMTLSTVSPIYYDIVSEGAMEYIEVLDDI